MGTAGWVLTVLAILLILIIIWLLLWVCRANRQQRKADEEYERHRAHMQQALAVQAARAAQQNTAQTELAQAQKAAEELLQCDSSSVLQLLSQLTGVREGDLRHNSDPELVQEIVRKVNYEALTVLCYASRSNTQFDDINLSLGTATEHVDYPADMFEIERFVRDEDIANVLPEELALDDECFYANFADDNLSVVRYYESQSQKRRIYILVDVSESMGQNMDLGKRIHWAAGVALRLMFRAQEGSAEYHLREFGSGVYASQQVFTPEQAASMIRYLLKLSDRKSGTNIQRALQQAVSDMKSANNSEVSTSDILLISDGESDLDNGWLASTFGDDSQFQLHVALIAADNTWDDSLWGGMLGGGSNCRAQLRKHAVSYQEYT